MVATLGVTERVSSAPDTFNGAPTERPAPTAPDPADVRCLSQALYWEARGEGGVGMQAVADVILARLARRWRGAETICDVVLASHQFEGMKRAGEPIRSPEAMRRAIWIAGAALGPGLPTRVGADHYHAVSILPAWAKSPDVMRVARIGGHVFYLHK